VTLDHFPTPQAARRAFTELPDLDIPGEEDGAITPAGPLGIQYAAALGGRFLGYATHLDQATAILQAAMAADRFWPDAWFIGDHGNPHRLDLSPP
jgi:hypothetical protein